ncbi:MAG: HAD-IA family hydrolase [Rhizobiaceae bacterium]
MPAPDLIIFDCDGVLVDSEIIAARVESDMLARIGYPIAAEELVERFAGLTFHDILLTIEREAGIPLQASLLDENRRVLDEVLAREVIEIEGAARIAATVPRRCICSNSRAERIEAMLDRTGMKPIFDKRIFSASDTPSAKPKPAPDVFLHAAEKMQADPANTFVIEDSVHGVAGAVAAGMRVIGFTGGAHSFPGHADRLTEAGAETVINRWSGFLPVLAALTEWQDA